MILDSYVLDKIKSIIGIKEFDNTTMLINIDDKLPNDIVNE